MATIDTREDRRKGAGGLPTLPWSSGAGIELLDGRVLTYEPHADCPCADCRAAHRFGRFLEDGDGGV